MTTSTDATLGDTAEEQHSARATWAAVANAIYNATGIRVHDYPITLDKLLDRMPDAA